jgi:hypothetical protein
MDYLDRRVNSCFTLLHMKKPKTDEDGFELVLTKTTRAEIARHLGIKKQNLTRWRKVPPHHVPKISELTGLARDQILPSLYA